MVEYNKNTIGEFIMDKEKQILEKLSRIIDPDLGRDIVSLGFIKDMKITDDGDVFFSIELTTPACPIKEQFRNQATAAVKELDWVNVVEVNMTARQQQRGPQTPDGMKNVQKIIGVSSCKGGVGKSTAATNLAFALQANDAKVGIFDADIYGPSLPTMVSTDGVDGLYYSEGNLLRPVEHASGMKLMSFAYANAKGGPAIMRGPMVSQVVQQLLVGCDWGYLDYLIIDLPPGTGDIQLTISQTIAMDAAVIVTTPQKISFIDVVKGIDMFDKLEVPVVGVIENMSYFLCDSCDAKHRIFGEGAMQKLMDQYGIQNAFEIPIVPAIATQGDSGLPLVAAEPDGDVAKIYRDLAGDIVREVSRVAIQDTKPSVTFENGSVLVKQDGTEKSINAAALRRVCGCAHCVDEFSGEKRLVDTDIPEDIQANDISTMGNYAVQISWSDGHSSIYPYKNLAEIEA